MMKSYQAEEEVVLEQHVPFVRGLRIMLILLNRTLKTEKKGYHRMISILMYSIQEDKQEYMMVLIDVWRKLEIKFMLM